MRYYPINLDVRGQPVTVIGGGKVACRKVKTLLRAGGRVTVVAPRLEAPLARLALQRKVVWKKRLYRTGDLRQAFLAIAATDEPAVNRQVRREACQRGVLLNVVDCPDLCDFTLPALVSRGELLLTISTGGQAPALAKQIRQRIEKGLGRERSCYLKRRVARCSLSLDKERVRERSDSDTDLPLAPSLTKEGGDRTRRKRRV